MKFRVVIEADESGGFVASCPTLPGCWSQGETREEAVRNITESIEAYLEGLEKSGDPVPLPITEEIIEIPSAGKRRAS
jgi:antitoxin HicB